MLTLNELLLIHLFKELQNSNLKLIIVFGYRKNNFNRLYLFYNSCMFALFNI